MCPPAASRTSSDHQPEDGHERFWIPGSARREAGETPVKRVVDVGGREREVDRNGRPRVTRRSNRGERREPLGERRPSLSCDLEPGGAGMATVPDEKIRAGLEGGTEIEAAVAPA